MMDSSAEEPGAYPGLAQAILLILALVTSQFILAIATIIIIGEDTFHWFTQFVISVISFGLAISIGLQAGRLSLKEVMALRPVHNGVWLPLIILLAGLTIVLSEIDNALRSVWPMPESLVEAFLQLRANWIAFILLGVLLAPITEELLFRGLILRGLLQHYSVNRAVVLSALLFAMVHLSPWQFTGAFVFGLLSGFLYFRTGSLIPSLGAHALLNGYGIVVGGLLPPISGFNTDPLGAVEFHPWWFDMFGLALTVIGIILLLEHFQLRVARSHSASEGQDPELP